MHKFENLNEKGKITMSDITGNLLIIRDAEASGFIHLKPETIRLFRENEPEKSEMITLAELAGVQAAKKATELIPLVHQKILTCIDVKAYVYPNGIEVKSTVKSRAGSSLEAEAITAVSTALTTLYELCKSVDHSIVISDIKIQRRSPNV